ncbi:SCO1664 family protein [Streptomyces xinghaiensis]|uniref:SCO1664 family protein n=1 Tax=Streptomyces xinghaiensis TaxID=1038928 RepID=UPI000BAEEEEC|nr:SCO1664 family protein [Streptomyces xinghaiensis]
MSAPERIPPGPVTSAETAGPADGAPTGPPGALALLARGELTVDGRVGGASNTVLRCTAELDGRRAACVYKPVAGERPLWDFPDGSLARRETAAYEVSRATGWDLVPPTVLRDGPYGEGMCQLWIEADPEAALLALVEAEEPGPGWRAVGFADVGEGRTALLVHADDPRLRRLAVFDAVVNNADRKGGHLLPDAGGRLHAIDHGVTFNAEDKLRTLLWGWAGEPLPAEAVGVLERLAEELAPGGPLAGRLAGLITPAETDAVRTRVARLLRTGRHPEPGGDWPAIPWPPI